MTDTLSLRALSRATLARQILLRRERIDVAHAVERLAGMQAQLARAPFVGLWTRVEDLARADVQRALDEKRIVRATLMRGTLHVMSARDYVALRGTIQLALDQGLRAVLKARMKEVEVADVLAKARAFFAEPRTFEELRDSGQFTGDVRAKAYAARMMVPLVQMHDGSARFVLAEKYLAKKIPTKADARELVRRYLAAFGPATVADAQTWSGIPSLRDAFDAIREELVAFRDDKKRELFDLAKAPRPGEDAQAPPRFLPEFDNLVLSHKDRRRFVADVHRKAVYLPALRVAATILVDGVIAGTWKVERVKSKATLTVTPFAKLARATRDALVAEGTTLARFAEPEATAFDVVIGSPS